MNILPRLGGRAAVSIALQDKEAEATWATELQHDAEGIPRTIERVRLSTRVTAPHVRFQKRTDIEEGLEHDLYGLLG